MPTRPKIIVLDDDPTGSQTVHSCLLLTRWDVGTLRQGLLDDSPIFFVLTNTRAMPAAEAAATTRQVCRNLKLALAEVGMRDFVLVSRSDSTLRGHYPIETDVMAAELGPFDAHFLIPAFLEGGRITRNSIHYLIINGQPVPVHETEFARDSVFAYHHSYLPDYVEEKTQGRIRAAAVERFGLSDLREGDLAERLRGLAGNVCGVVDAEVQSDLDRFAAALLSVAATGKRFLLRSAASILTALAALPPQPVAAAAMGRFVRGSQPGAVVVGSHVQRSTEQLRHLLAEPVVVGIEVAVERLLQDPVAEMRTGQQQDALLTDTLARIQQIHQAGQTPVIFTSREELRFGDAATRLAFGKAVSGLLMDVVRGLPADIGYLISKGGITSNDVLSTGLEIAAVRLLGQIWPGCSLVIAPFDHPQFPNLPVVLFPGNVGDADTLVEIHRRLSKGSSTTI